MYIEYYSHYICNNIPYLAKYKPDMYIYVLSQFLPKHAK